MSSIVDNLILQQGRGKTFTYWLDSQVGDYLRMSRSVVNKQRQVVRFTALCCAFLCNPLVALVTSLKQITTAWATTVAVTEKVWGENVSVVCQILEFSKAKYKDVRNMG